jgi:cyclopropane-fatty-acyl-phospholipid synthase
VLALGLTLSRDQAAWAQAAIVRAGLGKRAEVRHLDWRDLPEQRFDAISSVGAMEHFGRAQLAFHFSAMAALLRPGGRMLNHCITRPTDRARDRGGPFIDRYVFPDGELLGPATVIGAIHDNGFELRHTESLAASRLAFQRNRVQVHQMLGVHVGSDGASEMPLRPDWEHEQPSRRADLRRAA